MQVSQRGSKLASPTGQNMEMPTVGLKPWAGHGKNCSHIREDGPLRLSWSGTCEVQLRAEIYVCHKGKLLFCLCKKKVGGRG